jgi:hypothetical protein
MTDHDSHVQHTWNLTHTNGDRITIDLWTDNETVRVDGGDHEAADVGRPYVDQLLTKYQAAGYRIERDYPVNDPEDTSADVLEDDDPEPHGRPENCPDCGASVTYDPRYSDDYREGPAWLCTGCKWGQWLTA